MGQKVNPVGFRTGIMVGWKSRWYASKQEFPDLLIEDFKVRKFIKRKYRFAGIPKIEIERTRDEVKVMLHTARPGIIIGRKGQEVERLQDELQDLIGRRINIKIEEIARPEIHAQLVAEDIAEQLAKRASFRRTHEAGDGHHDGGRRQGNQDSIGRPAGRIGNGAPRKADRRLDPAVHVAGQDRLRLHRSQDAAGTHRRASVGQPRHVQRTRPMALMPKRVKHRKSQRGRIKGNATRGNRVVFGDSALQATQGGWLQRADDRSRPRRRAAVLRSEGRLYIRVFPHKPITSIPLETRMGKGKGKPEYWAAVVRPGTVLYEVGGVSEEAARMCFARLAHKMPVRVRFLKRRAM